MPMCIIATKPSGVAMPDQKTIETMWYNNPDGAGFMYAKDGAVHISKGYMKLADFTSAINKLGDLTNTAVVMHFRIATHGGVIPANTHPFPVSTSVGILQKLKCTTKLGVAHNGIINSVTPRKGISDTMEYIATQLGPLYKGCPTFYTNKYLLEMIDNAVCGKLAFLTGDGEIYTVGKFEKEDGMMYSNTSYLPRIIYSTWDKNLKDWNTWKDYGYYDDIVEGYRLLGSKVLRMIDGTMNEYLIDPTGQVLDPSEYDLLVDTDGKVYTYEYMVDGAILWAGARLYDEYGKPMYADADSKEPFTYIENIYEEVYEYDDKDEDTYWITK